MKPWHSVYEGICKIRDESDVSRGFCTKIQPLTRLSCYALMILSVSHQEKQMPAYAVACFSLACDKPKVLRYSIYAFFIDSNSSMISCSGAFVSKLTTTMKMQATINAGSNS